MNFLFISPNFPEIYYKFVVELKNQGINVFGIGDEYYDNLHQKLKANLIEYCRVSDMNNTNWMIDTIRYLENKYGKMDYIESNNEYWLFNDSFYRETFNTPNGFRPNEMNKIKFKSEMKKYFNQAGVKTARYILVSNIDESKKFIDIVGYPVFVKPNNGVGAANSYSIHNEEELFKFHNSQLETQYIMEEFIDGEIISFDGICDDDSIPQIYFRETFSTPIADIVNNDLDDHYYAECDFDNDFKEKGFKVVKAFGIKKRCFHIEFFRLNSDKEGLAKKGEIIGLECNMRSPGGYTPEILSIALNSSYYKAYAEIISNNSTSICIEDKHFIGISVARKDRFHYINKIEEITSRFDQNLVSFGKYPKSISDALGDDYFFGKFDNVEDALKFQKFIQEKY